MSEIKKKQYNLLNALKIIAAFFVVCIHIHFPGDFGRGVVAVARFAVPFFFMVSGFFSYYPNKDLLNVKYKRKIRHLLILFGGSLLMYFSYNVLGSIMNGTLGGYLKGIFSLPSIVELFVFNHVRVMEVLWFLPALIYTTLIFFVFEKTGITKKMYFLIPVLFISGVVLREIPEFVRNTPEIMSKAYLCRNFLFVGLPFFMLGHFIKANEEKLKEKFSNTALLIITLLGTAEAVVTDLLHTQKSVYIGTLFAVFALFVFAIKNEERMKAPRLAFLGAEYSLYVYIFHILIRDVIRKLGEIIAFAGNVTEILEPVMPIMIFALTLVLSAVYVYVKKYFKQKMKKQEK